jgi:hypothetical protein
MSDGTSEWPGRSQLPSMLGMDLRAEPIVLTVPPIEKGRYFSVQLIFARGEDCHSGGHG